MKKYLITGCSGFVGRHFIDYLEQRHRECIVLGVDLQTPRLDPEGYRHVRFSFDQTDLLFQDDIESVVAKFQPDFILHLASQSSVAASWKRPVETFLNNTNIFLNLIEAVRRQRVSCRILSVGSSEQYGNVNETDLPLSESHELNPVSPYAAARSAQEHLSRVYAEGYGLDIVLTRSFNHVGPGQTAVFVVSFLVKQMVEIKRSGRDSGTVIAGDVSIVRDFIDVRDVVAAYDLLLQKGASGNIYNVCSGVGLSIRDIIDQIAKQLQLIVDIEADQLLFRPVDSKIIIGSNQKIKKEVEWCNKIPFEQSLRDMIAFWEAKWPFADTLLRD